MADASGIGKDDSDVGCHRNERNREMESSAMYDHPRQTNPRTGMESQTPRIFA
jgi:hypothetical protein